MKPKILIEIKGGCLYNVTANWDIKVFLKDHDVEEIENVSVDTITTNDEFDKLID